jgi:hypothetical protein
MRKDPVTELYFELEGLTIMKWKQEYDSLRNYITDRPEIVINPTEISIPQNLRDEFYRRFDQLRRDFVEDHYSAMSVDFNSLCENYLKIEKEITGLLGLEGITMPMDLFSFLHTPKDGLMRILYNRTFDLLQGKTEIEAYEEPAVNDLRSVAAELYRLGYEQWAALVLIKLLEPDEAFLVDLDEDYKPILAELKSISFGRQAHHPTMRIPEFVLHSRKLNKYVAVKMVLAREIETYVAPFKPAVRPRKKTGDTSFALDSRVMLLSFMASPKDIPIIADIYDLKLTSPDWMMEFISARELEDPSSLDQVKRRLDAMKPQFGSCLVLIDSDRELSPEEIPEKVRTVSAGFDQARLQSVVDALAKDY